MLIRSLLLGLAASLSLVAPLRVGAEEPKSKPHLVIVMAEREYYTQETLPPFAKRNLQADFRITLLEADEADRNRIDGIEAVSEADVLLLSVRRRTLPPEQLDVIRQYVAAGKPVVGIRTASHAFCRRNEGPPAGYADWPEFDAEVFGGNYTNHHGNKVRTYVQTAPDAAGHPILQGIGSQEFRVFGSLYRCRPLAPTTTLLMTGRAKDIKPHQPVAWTNRPKTGNRVFYTSLGHPEDFTLDDFVRLLRNGIYWAAELPVPERGVVVLSDVPQR